ncbi:hypothetical protein [Micromonospora harpali]|uniref:Uncharacterized protein n=1 Tax=Micromonospora harpali TaxID=1490225 RepID=A0ABW1HX49_9ACTN
MPPTAPRPAEPGSRPLDPTGPAVDPTAPEPPAADLAHAAARAAAPATIVQLAAALGVT